MASIKWNDAIARAVRRHRADMGISQERLAELAGITRGYVSRIETGDVEISLAVFVRLATALGMAPWELLKDAELAIPKRKLPKS